MRFSREHYIGQVWNGLLQSRITVDRVLPNLVGVRAQINFGVRVTVEDASLFREKITNRPVVLVILEEHFIRPYHLSVLTQPLTDTGAQPNDAFNSVCRQKRVTENFFSLLPDTVHASGSLD